MGYTTEFEGHFNLDKPLTEDQAAYLKAFAFTRRMDRDELKASKLPDPLRESVGLPVGRDGGYYVGSHGDSKFGQTDDISVTHHNNPPGGQPGLWCQWVPTEDHMGIEWDGNEKFYYYSEWLIYIVENFLKPWGYTLNGVVEWTGEQDDDWGTLLVSDNYLEIYDHKRPGEIEFDDLDETPYHPI